MRQSRPDHGVIAPEDERSLDTERIQNAMDTCARASGCPARQGNKNVFLTGRFALRTGVTLVVERIHRAGSLARPAGLRSRSRQLRHRLERGHGCKPLIIGDGVQDGGIMGEGSIDGRGGAKLLGQDVTWWDLAHEAKITTSRRAFPG